VRREEADVDYIWLSELLLDKIAMVTHLVVWCLHCFADCWKLTVVAGGILVRLVWVASWRSGFALVSCGGKLVMWLIWLLLL
jgi:hypothetical protein